MAYAKIDTLTNSSYEIIMCFSDTTQFKYELYRKPAIYLYPETEQEINILHDFKGTITTTYPAYNKGWKVIAGPEGKLYNTADQRNYPYLFWEGAYGFTEAHYQYKDGFYIEKKDYIEFLQTKLALIGLNDTEITDFIMFWLPALNKYPFVFLHFRINDNIDNTSFLNIQPEPDTFLRVFMEFKGMQNLTGIEILPEQVLIPIPRKGFTVTEWGGAQIMQFELVSEE